MFTSNFEATRRPWFVGLAALIGLACVGVGGSFAAERGVSGEFSAYQAHIAAAQASFERGDVGDARRWLDGAPKRERSWEWHALHAELDDSERAFTVHTASVFGVAWSPDGKGLYSAGGDGSVRRQGASSPDSSVLASEKVPAADDGYAESLEHRPVAVPEMGRRGANRRRMRGVGGNSHASLSRGRTILFLL